jgi:hypothetical protein
MNNFWVKKKLKFFYADPDPGSFKPWIRDPGGWKNWDPGSGIKNLDRNTALGPF